MKLQTLTQMAIILLNKYLSLLTSCWQANKCKKSSEWKQTCEKSDIACFTFWLVALLACTGLYKPVQGLTRFLWNHWCNALIVPETLTTPYPPLPVEAHYFYYGIPSQPCLVAQPSSDLWVEPTGTKAYLNAKEASLLGIHPLLRTDYAYRALTKYPCKGYWTWLCLSYR